MATTYKKTAISILTGNDSIRQTEFVTTLVQKEKEQVFALIQLNPTEKQDTLSEEKKLQKQENLCYYPVSQESLFDLLYYLTDTPCHFDHILLQLPVEGEPSEFIYSFVTDCCIASKFYINSVIAITSLANIASQLAHNPIFAQQVAWADQLVLHTDSAEVQNHAKDDLRQLNPTAKIIYVIPNSNSTSYIPEILHRKAYHLSQLIKDIQTLKPAYICQHPYITSCTFCTSRNFNIDKLRKWLNEVLTFKIQYIYQIKALINTVENGIPCTFILQSFRENIVLIPCKYQKNRDSGFLFIGKDLDPVQLQEKLKNNLISI